LWVVCGRDWWGGCPLRGLLGGGGVAAWEGWVGLV